MCHNSCCCSYNYIGHSIRTVSFAGTLAFAGTLDYKILMQMLWETLVKIHFSTIKRKGTYQCISNDPEKRSVEVTTPVIHPPTVIERFAFPILAPNNSLQVNVERRRVGRCIASSNADGMVGMGTARSKTRKGFQRATMQKLKSMYLHNSQIEHITSTQLCQSIGDTPCAVEDNLFDPQRFRRRSRK